MGRERYKKRLNSTANEVIAQCLWSNPECYGLTISYPNSAKRNKARTVYHKSWGSQFIYLPYTSCAVYKHVPNYDKPPNHH